MNYKFIFYTYFFLLLLLLSILYIFIDLDYSKINGITFISFFLTGAITVINLFANNKVGYSLKDVIIIFSFFFLFLAPMVQYISGGFPWWNLEVITDESIIITNFIIMIFLILYFATYKMTGNNISYKNIKVYEIRNLEMILNCFFILSSIASLFLIYSIGLTDLFSRFTSTISISPSIYSLIIGYTFRAFSVYYIALNIIYYKIHNKIYRWIPFIIGSILFVLVNFPTGVPRFWMASIYLGLLISTIKVFKNPNTLKNILFLGLLIVFPIINIFRYNTFSNLSSRMNIVIDPQKAFLIGDFDAYSMLLRAIYYADVINLKFGSQLIGNLLFFVPRAMWDSKPIGSGATIAEFLGWGFINVSMPFIGEGYINFGILGVIIFAIILGFLTKHFDQKRLHTLNFKKTFYAIDLIYPFSLGFLFFIMRGDLLSSLSNFVAFLLPIIFLFPFMRLINLNFSKE